MGPRPNHDDNALLSLILFRHGKSDWDANYDADHDRPLAERGRTNARCMGQLLAQAEQIPDLAVSSSARRARDTLSLAMKAGRWQCAAQIDAALYETTPQAVVAWLREIDTTPERLLLVGHEPTWSELASRLSGGGVLRVPTGAMLRLDLELDSWRDIAFGQAELRWLMPPKVVCRLKGLG